MKKDIRKISRCYNVRAAVSDHQLKLTFNGENSHHADVEFHVTMPFYFVEYLIREAAKTWQQERDYRSNEIARIDSVLPK